MRLPVQALAEGRFLPSAQPRQCRDCRHFANDAASIEARIAGVSTLSSGHASIRLDDGLCALRDLYLPAKASCEAFEDRKDG